MTARPFTTPLERVRALADRRLTAAELDAYIEAPLSEDERNEALALSEWFCRRYATVLDRWRWNDRSYRAARAWRR